MKKIAFTICSNNYLSQVKVLSDSILYYNKDEYDFYVVLCDKYDESIDYSMIHANFILVEELGIENFKWMINHYNIVELNTAVKPFAFYKFFKDGADLVYYFDPDIKCFCKFDVIENELNDYEILLTPHSLKPLYIDGKIPNDSTFLNYGIYNLGFCGLKKGINSNEMLDWWMRILCNNCHNLTTIGLFVDQLPMNLVPLYFDNVKVTKHKGMNVSWWNLHDRNLLFKNSKYIMDNNDPLVFFHFSNYKISRPDEVTIEKRYNREDPMKSLTIKKLYEEYNIGIQHANKYYKSNVRCFYSESSWIDKLKID